MNSLPFISHHLFVAAIGNEGRLPDRSTRRKMPAAGPGEQATPVALELVGARDPMPEVTTPASRVRTTQTQA
jgi:hypothetical protein